MEVQWIRIRLSIQGTRVQSSVREDRSELLKPVHHNCRACSLEPGWRAIATKAHTPQSLCSATREATEMSSPHY